LVDLLADDVKRIKIDDRIVEDIKQALRESHQDKIDYHNNALKALNKRAQQVRKLIDKDYEDKLSGVISEDFWQRKSIEWNNELTQISADIESYENANYNYLESGVKILELANQVYSLYLAQSRFEQRKLLNIILSNCTFFRGTLYPTYKKTFDIFAKRLQFKSIRDRPPSQQTFVTFEFQISFLYKYINGTRWKTISYEAS